MRRDLVVLSGVALALAVAGHSLATKWTPNPQPHNMSIYDPGEVPLVAKGFNTLGPKMASVLHAGYQNFVISPYSAGACLSLLYPGLSNQDRNLLAEKLGLRAIPAKQIADSVGGLQKSLTDTPEHETVVSNSVWMAPGAAPVGAYKGAVQHSLLAEVDQLNQLGSQGAAQINSWVKEKTKGRIERLFDTLDDRTLLVLVNAVAFDGQWVHPFQSSRTSDQGFSVGDINKRIPTMSQKADFRYVKGNGYAALEAPYVGGRYAMDIVLPDHSPDAQTPDPSPFLTEPGRMQSVIHALSASQLQPVVFSLPKFSDHFRYNLTPDLDNLGFQFLTKPFSGQRLVDSGRPCVISSFIQAIFIQVDELGTKAAAATGGAVSATAIQVQPAPKVFRVDHPFVVVIRDVLTGAHLFEGVIYNPGSSSG